MTTEPLLASPSEQENDPLNQQNASGDKLDIVDLEHVQLFTT